MPIFHLGMKFFNKKEAQIHSDKLQRLCVLSQVLQPGCGESIFLENIISCAAKTIMC